jgi:TetR/AcrR family transcriptional regulator
MRTGRASAHPRPSLIARRKMIRETIVQAAIEEFAAKGLAGASTQSIALRAGLTKPQLHYYITSKEELYEEVLGSITDLWRTIFISSTSEKDPEKVLRLYIRRKLEFAWQQPSACRLFANEVAAGGHYLRKFWDVSREAAGESAELIQSWIDQGLIRPVDPWLFQMHIWAVTQHYADYESQIRYMLQIPEGHAMDGEHIVEEVTNLFLRGCGLK